MQTIAAFVNTSFNARPSFAGTKIQVLLAYVVPQNSTLAAAPLIKNKPTTARTYAKVEEIIVKTSFDF
jgi:hypothetical protein